MLISVLLFNDNTIIAKKDTLLQLVTLKNSVFLAKRYKKGEKIQLMHKDTVATSPSSEAQALRLSSFRGKNQKDTVDTVGTKLLKIRFLLSKCERPFVRLFNFSF